MKFTVFGSQGFIGSHLTRSVIESGHECLTPERDDYDFDRELGHVIWAVGLTADFRDRPMDTVRAHVASPIDVVERGRFESFLYLSSTRVYAGAARGTEETTFSVDPTSLSDLYNISKLMGESLCHASLRPNMRVARLSNVFGGDFESTNFLTSVIRDAVEKGEIVFSTAPDSAKDYISIDDVVRALFDITTRGRHPVYNVASGINTSNAEIAQELQTLTGCDVRFANDAPLVNFPSVSIDRLQDEFEFQPVRLVDALPALVRSFSAVSTQ